MRPVYYSLLEVSDVEVLKQVEGGGHFHTRNPSPNPNPKLNSNLKPNVDLSLSNGDQILTMIIIQICNNECVPKADKVLHISARIFETIH